MRIVLATHGSEGDCRPVLALGWALRNRGHEPVLVADVSAAEPAAALGLELRVLAADTRAILSGDSAAIDSIMRSRQALLRESTRLMMNNSKAWMTEIEAAAEGADLLVAVSCAQLHGLSVAEAHGLPAVAVDLQPVLPTRAFPPPLMGRMEPPPWLNKGLGHLLIGLGWYACRGPINKVRRAQGRRPMPRPRSGGLTRLGAWSPVIAPPPKDWGSQITLTGAWGLPASALDAGGWTPPHELAEFLRAGEPPVYVGFGSMSGFRWADLRDTILTGLSGRRVLLSDGWAGMTDGDLPANVHPIGWVPHDWLFPRCAAVIQHCGAGTSQAAARSGVPTIPVPILGDQHFWARRLRDLGVASAPLAYDRLTPASVESAVIHVEHRQVRERATALADILAGEDGVGVAADAIEQVAARHRAISGARGPRPQLCETPAHPGVRRHDEANRDRSG